MPKLPAWEINRTVLVKAEEETNPEYGTAPEERLMRDYIKYGMLIMDKPPGPTSHEVVAWIKKLLELDKAGHGGTLDPKVTGVLPVGLQESTKVVQALLDSGKIYVCVMRTHGDVEESRVKSTLNLFKGEILQRPPVRSSVARRLRTRYIYDIDYHEGDGRNWLFTVACQSGTYIRKLCFDVGEILGDGAHMQELRRVRSGPFVESEIHTMLDLVDAVDLYKNGDEASLRELIRPYEDALALQPKIWVRDTAVDAICTGAGLAMPGILRMESGINRGDLVAVLTQKGEAVALMKAERNEEQIMDSEHGIAALPARVLMQRGTYPKSW